MSANVRSSARKSGKRRVASASRTTPRVTSGKSWPLATIWVPSRIPARGALERAPARPRPRRARRRCRSRGGRPGSRSRPASRRARAAGARSRRRGGPRRASRSSCSASGAGSRWPQWWQATSPAERCRTSATSHCGHSHTRPQLRQVRKLAQPRRLSSTIAFSPSRRTACSASAVSGCSAWAASRMSSTSHRRQRAAVDARGQHEALEPVHALGPRRGRPGHEHRAGLARATRGDRAGVVARVALVLVGGVVLLVDDEQAEVADGREHRRARARRRCAPRRARSRRHSS